MAVIWREIMGQLKCTVGTISLMTLVSDLEEEEGK